jgi:hypothetical protein
MPPRKSHAKPKEVPSIDAVTLKHKCAPDIQWAKNPDWTYTLIKYLTDVSLATQTHNITPPTLLIHSPGNDTATHLADMITITAGTTTGDNTATYSAGTTHQH